MTRPKIVITGGSGRIGSYAVKQFMELGWEIIVIDKAETYKESNRGFQLVVSDISTDFNAYEQFFQGAHLVWHLAAETDVSDSVLNPRQYMKSNVMGTINVLQAAMKHHVPRVIFTSSADCAPETYNAQNAHAVSKMCCEDLCHMYRRLYKLDVVVARIHNVWGTEPVLGMELPEQRRLPVVDKFANSIKNGKTIFVHGDGSQTRDFIHVKDVINALMTLSLPDNKNLEQVFEVGSGVEHSIMELLQIIDPDNTNPMYVCLLETPSVHSRSVADNESLRDLGWTPTVTLEDFFTTTKS
jgi:UDP-glucose 4-epimerase